MRYTLVVKAEYKDEANKTLAQAPCKYMTQYIRESEKELLPVSYRTETIDGRTKVFVPVGLAIEVTTPLTTDVTGKGPATHYMCSGEYTPEVLAEILAAVKQLPEGSYVGRQSEEGISYLTKQLGLTHVIGGKDA